MLGKCRRCGEYIFDEDLTQDMFYPGIIKNATKIVTEDQEGHAFWFQAMSKMYDGVCFLDVEMREEKK